MSADERVGSESRARLAADLAVLGGRLALERFHRVHASSKRDGAVAADADLAIQDTLGREIARLFPADGLGGDEPGEDTRRSHARYAWVLGPVDDTSNFARGMPGFAVSVGVLRGGMPFAGAVYDPVARWLFTGCAGRGAWLNDRPLRARPEAVVGPSLFAARTPWAAGVPPYADSWMRRYGVRRFGSTALHLCYVALGGLDFVHDDRASLWDIAGAAPVLLEAGGILTTDSGGPLFPLTGAHAAGAPIALLAGHARAHADAVRDVRAARTPAVTAGASYSGAFTTRGRGFDVPARRRRAGTRARRSLSPG
jgi:myo-inositol-1(or 4)-monophosphatase